MTKSKVIIMLTVVTVLKNNILTADENTLIKTEIKTGFPFL